MWLYTVLVVIGGLACLEFGLRLRERRRKAAPKPRTAPDWSAFTSYSELAAASYEAHWLTPEAFLEGPFKRFLEIMSESEDHPRVGARTMEFGRGAFLAYRDSQRELGVDPTELHARARAMAVEWFARLEPDDRDYLLEVFDGISNHNVRRGRPAASAARGAP